MTATIPPTASVAPVAVPWPRHKHGSSSPGSRVSVRRRFFRPRCASAGEAMTVPESWYGKRLFGATRTGSVSTAAGTIPGTISTRERGCCASHKESIA